jgi:hypothetical protein
MQIKTLSIFYFLLPLLVNAQCLDKTSFQQYLDTCQNLDPIEGIWTMNAGFWATDEQTRYFPFAEEMAILKSADRYLLCPLKVAAKRQFTYTEMYLYPTARANHFYLSLRLSATGAYFNEEINMPNAHFFGLQFSLPTTFIRNCFPNIELKKLEKESRNLSYNTLLEFVKTAPKIPLTAHAQRFSGTAFVVDAKKGILVTNAHYIDAKERIILTQFIKGKLLKFKAKLINKDHLTNLALLQIEDERFSGFSELKYQIGTTNREEKEVFMLGFPQETLRIINMPCVLALLGETKNSGLINLESGQILPGFSGSPLIDKYGNIRAVAMGGETYNRAVENYVLDVAELRTFLIENQIDIDVNLKQSSNQKVYPAMFAEHILFVETFE